MADYGLKLWNSSGTLILDTTYKLARLRYATKVAGGASGNTTLSDISGKDTAQFAILNDSDSTKMPHAVTRSGTQISWAPQDCDDFGVLSGDSYIVVFLFS